MTLSRSLDLETTVAEVGRLLVPRFADWCSLQLLRDGQLETVAVQHRDPETTEWARSMHRRLPDPHGRAHRGANVVRTGRERDLPVHPRRAGRGDRRQRGAPGDPAAPGVHQRDRRPADRTRRRRRGGDADPRGVGAPLQRRGPRVPGGDGRPGGRSPSTRRRRSSSSPSAWPASPWSRRPPSGRSWRRPRRGPVPIALSARYLSAAVEAQVGGDLYEVVPGPTSVRLLVGDVRGKGLSAVRTATVVLGEFRAAAAGTGDVAHVAREIDRRIPPYLPDAEDFVTGVLVDIEPRRPLQRRLLRPSRARRC